MTSNGLGTRIRQTREARGMNRVRLAADAEIALNSVRNYEDGLTNPSTENLRRVARALGVDVNWLIEGDREEAVQ